MSREAFRDLNRLRQLSLIAARHGFGELTERSLVWQKVGKRETVEVSAD